MRPLDRNEAMDNSWRELYEAAILETDRSKLGERIAAAEQAIRARMRELGGQPPVHVDKEEHLAIEGALSGLKILQGDMRESRSADAS